MKGTLLNGFGARIVQVDDYMVDVVPEGHLIFVKHTDKPGAIGRVGTLLAGKDINIATMQVGRSNQGGNAIMMLSVDNAVENLEFLTTQESVFEAKAINL